VSILSSDHPSGQPLVRILSFSCILSVCGGVVLIGCHHAGSTVKKRFAESMNGAQDEPSKESNTSPNDERQLTLTSRLFATPISFDGDPQDRKITSLVVRANIPSDGDGRGTLELNQTILQFTEFGDAKAVGEHPADQISVQFKRSPIEDPKGQNRELYRIVIPDNLKCELYLVLAKSTSDKSRLVIANGNEAKNVITLMPDSAEEHLPSSANAPGPASQFDLTSDVALTERGLQTFRIQGELGGEGRFFLDPNFKSYSIFGDLESTTLLGWEPLRTAIERQDAEDPFGNGRVLYEIAAESPHKTRYFLVISPHDDRHRLVIRQGETVVFVLPMRNSDSPGEF